MRALRSLFLSLFLTLGIALVVIATRYPEEAKQWLQTSFSSTGDSTNSAAETPVMSSAIDEPEKLVETADPAVLDAQMAELIGQTERYNERKFAESVPLHFLTREELRVKYLELVDKAESEESIAIAAKELTLLGLIEPNLDLHALLIDLMTEQIAGFYEFDTKSMFLIGDNNIGTMDKAIVVHELTHALQDQVQDLSAYEADLETNDDAALAFSAAIEGQATLVMQRYLAENVSGLGLLGLLAGTLGGAQSELMSQAPRAIQASLTFPYEAGLLFANSVGGRLELLSRLPVSTEQILHPEKYATGEAPLAVDIDEATKHVDTTEWTLLNENVMGEAGWRITFAEFQTEAEAALAAAGWGGDRYRTYENERSGQLMMVVASVWDSRQDAEEFSNAMMAHHQTAHGYQVTITWRDQRVDFTISPNNRNTSTQIM